MKQGLHWQAKDHIKMPAQQIQGIYQPNSQNMAMLRPPLPQQPPPVPPRRVYSTQMRMGEITVNTPVNTPVPLNLTLRDQPQRITDRQRTGFQVQSNIPTIFEELMSISRRLSYTSQTLHDTLVHVQNLRESVLRMADRQQQTRMSQNIPTAEHIRLMRNNEHVFAPERNDQRVPVSPNPSLYASSHSSGEPQR